MRPGPRGQTLHTTLNNTVFRNSAGRRNYPRRLLYLSAGRKREGGNKVREGGRGPVFVCPRTRKDREKERDIYNMRVKLAGIWNVPSSLPSAERAQGALLFF